MKQGDPRTADGVQLGVRVVRLRHPRARAVRGTRCSVGCGESTSTGRAKQHGKRILVGPDDQYHKYIELECAFRNTAAMKVILQS